MDGSDLVSRRMLWALALVVAAGGHAADQPAVPPGAAKPPAVKSAPKGAAPKGGAAKEAAAKEAAKKAAAESAAAGIAAEIAIMKRAAPEWAPTLVLATDTFLVGSVDFGFEITAPRAGYLTILQTSTDGTRDVIFPSAVDRDNSIGEGSMRLPRPNWQWEARGPAGMGRILVVLTPQAPDPEAVQKSWAAGRAPDFGPKYGAAIAEYQEVAGKAR